MDAPPKTKECTLKMDHFKRNIIVQPLFFRWFLLLVFGGVLLSTHCSSFHQSKNKITHFGSKKKEYVIDSNMSFVIVSNFQKKIQLLICKRHWPYSFVQVPVYDPNQVLVDSLSRWLWLIRTSPRTVNHEICCLKNKHKQKKTIDYMENLSKS